MEIIPMLIIVICIVLSALLVLRKYQKYNQDGRLTSGETYRLVGMIAVIGIIGILTINSFTTVQVGHAKLVIDPLSGNIRGPHLGEKWFFRMPWTRTVDIYYATLSTEMWSLEDGTQGEYPAVKVLSKDGLDIEVDVLIRYSLDPTAIIALYQKYPDLQYERKAVSSVTREDVRDVVSNYMTLEIIEKREALSVEMANKIVESLSNAPSLASALINIQIDLRDIDPPASFKQAVAEKKKAEQQKLQAEYERETKLIQADALARALVINADATREALESISSIIDPDIYYSLQQLEKIAPYTKYLILTMGENGVPIILQEGP